MFFNRYPVHLYVAKCSDGTLYTGVTNNLEKRLRQHNGELWGGARYTKAKGPVEYVYIKKYATRSEAMKREYEIKHTLTRQQKMDLINSTTKKDILESI